QLRAATDRSGPAVEATWRRESILPDPWFARGDDRPALFSAGDNEPVAAGVVRAQFPGPQPVPPVRVVEPGIDAGAARLSVRARAVGGDANAVVRLVGRVCRVRRAYRRLGVV